jgi:hypothetical protein
MELVPVFGSVVSVVKFLRPQITFTRSFFPVSFMSNIMIVTLYCVFHVYVSLVCARFGSLHRPTVLISLGISWFYTIN